MSTAAAIVLRIEESPERPVAPVLFLIRLPVFVFSFLVSLFRGLPAASSPASCPRPRAYLLLSRAACPAPPVDRPICHCRPCSTPTELGRIAPKKGEAAEDALENEEPPKEAGPWRASKEAKKRRG